MKELVDILVFCGQSNMQGQTGSMPINNLPVENAQEYRFLTDTLSEMKHPVGENIYKGDIPLLLSADEGHGSIVPSFCDAYIRESGRRVVAIHVAKGNTRIDEWLPQTDRYACAVKKIRAGIAKTQSIGEIGHVFFVWLQGESDAIAGTSCETYYEYLHILKESLKKDVGIEKFGIIKVGYFYSTSQWHTQISNYKAKKACDEAVMYAQELAVERDEDFIMLTRICPEISLNAEYINLKASGHYNNEGADIIGKLAGAHLAKI